MRMIDHDVSIAQCNLRPLVRLPEGKQLTLEAFGANVRRSLGEQAVQLVEGDQRVTAQGLRLLRIVIDGETQGVPIRWIMMHFSDDHGRRVQSTFTLSGDKLKAFAGNDAQFADSMRFLEPAPTGTSPDPEAEPERDDAEAITQNEAAQPAAPSEPGSPTERVAQTPAGQTDPAGQSPSRRGQ
jgi:hypothetical protein